MRSNTIFIFYFVILLFIIVGCEDDTSNYTVKDIDGNIYHTVTIGTQVWMMENLNTTRYRNGDTIINATIWNDSTNGAYCNYDNNSINGQIYGKLYNWFAVNNNRNIAPIGWRVPTDNDWRILVDYLDSSVAGGKLKEADTIHWESPNAGANNSSGFTALPGGYRSSYGSFDGIGNSGYWWTSSEYLDTTKAWYYSMNHNWAYVISYVSDKRKGFSIRCIKE